MCRVGGAWIGNSELEEEEFGAHPCYITIIAQSEKGKLHKSTL